MNRDRTLKFMRLALGNPNENEAAVAAKRFFKQLPGRFSSKEWGITGDEARRLMKLAGVQIKGGEQPKPEPKPFDGYYRPPTKPFGSEPIKFNVDPEVWSHMSGLKPEDIDLDTMKEVLRKTRFGDKGYVGIIKPLNTYFSDGFWMRFSGLREVTLSQLCDALCITPTVARRKLRKVFGSGCTWSWTTGPGLETASRVITGYPI